MLYVGFGCAIGSFLRYTRHLIIIDGAHLKGNYLGTNLLVVGMDGNNQILPLATCVSQGKTGESWTWFLTKLKEQIGEPPNLCIISDRHAAIIQDCGTVFENSFHGFCDRRLMMNCNLKGKKLRGIFWKACKAYTTEDFDKSISELRGHRPIAVTKLEKACIEKRYMAYFPTSRYNYMTSNSVESINSLTRIVRRVPITMLVEYYQDLLQRWYCEKRHKYEGLTNCNLWEKLWFKKNSKKYLPRDGPTQRRKTVRTNSLFQTQTTDEHLSKAARMDVERMRNGRVYTE
uniref:Transposase, MuDR, MULE transposase domain protein n=1 Tax=Tanacetum cinerariifolium TaxID=118510 RepID=A0A6L2N9A3_TANCI|nr:transposase, MuDR, MULE transposase domain protein [Tanacetum cinerariifolium]